ncbi:MAG: arginine repressor [Oscillospiraceae bacterium]|nr:arginine repressor [Oscillospiraceae bacterium]
MKNNRQTMILDIIKTVDVDTQEQLLAELKKRGVSSTQATISRDIKELRLVKELHGGGYRYTVAKKDAGRDFSVRLNKIFKESVTSIDQAGHIVCVKTLPGLASAACSAIDTMGLPYIVGTLAGDDTAFILIRDLTSAAEFTAEVRRMLN